MTRTEEWKGFKRGDTVGIKGTKGTYTFHFHVKTRKVEWVELYGGYRNKVRWRYVRPEQVVRKPTRKRRKIKA